MLCRAKINLTLHVGAPIPTGPWSGYHPVDSLVVFADIGDTLTFMPGDANELSIDGPFSGNLSPGPHNLILKALKACRVTQSASLTKNLPVSAGLGGGSANAAAVLRAFDPEGHVNDASLGADVPVCRLSRTAMMEGVGDIVTEQTGLVRLPAVLVNPGVPVSTGRIFAEYDRMSPPREPMPTLRTGSLLERARAGRNDLESVAIAHAPVIADVLEQLASQPRCQMARMSGSGASCFGLFETYAAAQASAEKLAEKGWWSVAAWLGEEA